MIRFFVFFLFLLASVAAQAQGTFPGINNGTIDYFINGGTAQRNDAARWVDNWTEANEIGVDCTGVADSTSAIQTWVTGHLSSGGHLNFPFGCSVTISSTILINSGVNLTFSSNTNPGQGPGATFNWKGTNGGTACSSTFSSCVYMFDVESTDHPTFENLAFVAQQVGNGWLTDNCPDGFIKFDGNPAAHVGTAGHMYHTNFTNNCINPNFIAINISPTAVNNHENYILYDTIINCSVKNASQLGNNGVSNGTTILTATSGIFAANNAGRRIRVTHAGGEFDTTVATFNSSTQVTLAAAVPFSDSNEVVHIDQGYGIGVQVGLNQNALQQVIYKSIIQFCEVGIAQLSGNSSIDQPTGSANDYGIVLGSLIAQQTYVDFAAAEANYYDVFTQSGISTPVSFSHMRWSNSNQSAVGYVVLAGQARISDSFPNFGPPSSNANFFSPAFSYKVNSVGTIIGGSGYTNGTYNNITMRLVSGVPTPTVTGVGPDYGVKASVGVVGGAVTSLTITVPGTFSKFPLPVSSGFVSGAPRNIATWSLTAAPGDIGGTGSGFSVPVTSIVSNPIVAPGLAFITSLNNNWTIGNWTYSQLGFPSFSLNNQIVSINDQLDNNTTIGQNIRYCNSSNTSISGSGTCNKTVNIVNSGLGMDIETDGFTGNQSGPVVGYRNEGTIGFNGNNSVNTFTGFQNIPTSGAEALSWIGFENAAQAINTNHLTAGAAFYGFLARQQTSFGGSSVPNVYGFYTETQTLANVTTGWGIYSAGSSDSNFLAGNLLLGNNTLTVPTAGLGFAKIVSDAKAPGALGGKIELICGSNAGTARLIAYAGTSVTPTTILDNIGAGVTGC